MRPLVVFDMDGVLVEERSSWGLVHDLLGTTNEHSHEAYLRGEIDDMEFMRRDIALWLSVMPDLTIDDIRSMMEKATAMNGAEDCIRDLRALGADITILSGGLKLLSGILVQRWGLDGHHANGLEHLPDGRLTGEGILEVPLRDKGGVLARKIMTEGLQGPVITVGDSSVDISMFKRSDLAIAFRPKEERVSKRAHIVIERPDLRSVSGAVREWLKVRSDPVGAPRPQ
jgi:phosphoserine phosphatase